MSATILQQILSNGIAELMYAMAALATESDLPFADRRAATLEVIDGLSASIRSHVANHLIEAEPLVSALAHLSRLHNGLLTSAAEQPIPVAAEDVSLTFWTALNDAATGVS